MAISISIWHYAFSHGPLRNGPEATVYIPEGTGLRGVRNILSENDIIHNDIRFELLASMMNLGRRLKAGEYDFPDPSFPYDILLKLEKGSAKFRSVTILEGATIHQIADLFERKGIAKGDAFLSLASDPEFITDLDLDVESLEGYLFPDTYHFARGTPVETIIRKMVAHFHEIYNALLDEIQPDTSMSRHQIVTLASIVEKETGHGPERPHVAAVFMNRLQRHMRLQADPTVIYGLKRFDGNLQKKDLQTYSPYNTYMIKGLPPGPIANPGEKSIAAVLSPARVDSLYFVSKNNGTHYFSKTLKEHNRAVRKYQK